MFVPFCSCVFATAAVATVFAVIAAATAVVANALVRVFGLWYPLAVEALFLYIPPSASSDNNHSQFLFQALLIPSLPPQQRLADGLRQRRVECHQADRPLPRRPALRHDGEEEREGGGGRGGGVAAGIGGHYGDILSHGQQAKSHTLKYFIYNIYFFFKIRWRQGPRLPQAVIYGVSVSYRNSLLLLGGREMAGELEELDLVYEVRFPYFF